MKILLAYDGSPCSDLAIESVSRRPWPEGSELLLLMVDLPMERDRMIGSTTTVFDQIVQSQREASATALAKAKGTLARQAPGLEITTKLLEGSPKEVILEEAERWEADLIVVGSNGRGAFKRLFLGSVSLAIATAAPCSVEIIREKLNNQ